MTLFNKLYRNQNNAIEFTPTPTWFTNDPDTLRFLFKTGNNRNETIPALHQRRIHSIIVQHQTTNKPPGNPGTDYHQTPSGGRIAVVQWPPRVRGLHLAVPQHGLRGVYFRSWQRASNGEVRIAFRFSHVLIWQHRSNFGAFPAQWRGSNMETGYCAWAASTYSPSTAGRWMGENWSRLIFIMMFKQKQPVARLSYDIIKVMRNDN